MGDLIDRVDPADQILECQRCEAEVAPVFSESGPHIRADCPFCGHYLKFVRQNLSPKERDYWDQRKAARR